MRGSPGSWSTSWRAISDSKSSICTNHTVFSTKDSRNSYSWAGFRIVGIFFGLITSVLAIIFGGVAISRINNSGGKIGGHGMAVAGLVLGIIMTIVWVVILIVTGSWAVWQM